jgi:hypothetical protein
MAEWVWPFNADSCTLWIGWIAIAKELTVRAAQGRLRTLPVSI